MVLSSYTITRHTLWLQPFLDLNTNRIYTFVQEVEKSFVIHRRPEDIIRHGCRIYSGSYSKVRNHSHRTLKSDKLLPIVISHQAGITIFPTRDRRNSEQCVYLVNEQVDEIKKTSSGCDVLFTTGKVLSVSSKYETVDRQMHRSYQVYGNLVANLYRSSNEQMMAEIVED